MMFYTFTDKNGVEIVSHSRGSGSLGNGSPADFFQLISFEEIWNSAAKERAMKERLMRFGEFIKLRRQADPRGLTLKDIAEVLGISVSYLSDIEQGRRKPFDSAKIEQFCNFLGLSDEDRSRMYDLAARETGKVPSDIEDILMYTDIGGLAWHALRLSNAGVITENDWREFIRSMEERQDSNR